MLRATELIFLTEHGLDYRVHRKLKWHLTHFLRKINCRVLKGCLGGTVRKGPNSGFGLKS